MHEATMAEGSKKKEQVYSGRTSNRAELRQKKMRFCVRNAGFVVEAYCQRRCTGKTMRQKNSK